MNSPSFIVTFGNLCIGLSIGFALAGMILFFAARRSSSTGLAAWGRAAAYGNFIWMTVASLAMVYALLSDDFSVSYVAHVGSRETPRLISAISLWSSLEGSILFWGWILSAYTATCLYLYRERTEPMMNWVGLVLLGIELFFFILLALPANPFLPVSPVPENGPGPNPLLQNHWLMAVHPPCLYIGYIGFAIPFAFAIAALLESDLPGIWIRLVRRWTLFAWSFLSMAIVLGGWWSYAVLGWGGYWAWDPVENASFMPWLAGTALLHSLIVQEKRRLFPRWNFFLAILSFLLTLLGTFLTRSGVLDSVHSFTESAIGPYFLAFIGIVLASSLGLLLWKSPRRERGGERIENLLSLEGLFLLNNLLFLSFCFVVFLGTLYPLVVEALTGKRISIGEPYFNQMTVPLTGMILLLMNVGIAAPWGKVTPAQLWRASRWSLIAALVPAILALILGGPNPWIVVVTYLTSAAFLFMAGEWIRLGRRRGYFRLLADNPRRYGGFIAHTGALIVVIAVALSSTYAQNRELRLARRESAGVGSWRITFDGMQAVETPQRYEVKALLRVEKSGAVEGLTPQMNYYPNSREPIGTPAIRSTLLGDLYVTLISFEQDGSSASFRVIQAPAVSWIWVGGGLVMLGGLTSWLLGRKRGEGRSESA